MPWSLILSSNSFLQLPNYSFVYIIPQLLETWDDFLLSLSKTVKISKNQYGKGTDNIIEAGP